MDVTNKYHVLESITRNEVDFGLVSILPSNMRVHKLDLIQNKLFLVGNSKYKIETAEELKELLNKVPLIYRESGSGTRQLMERYVEKNNIFIPKKIELTSNEAVK